MSVVWIEFFAATVLVLVVYAQMDALVWRERLRGDRLESELYAYRQMEARMVETDRPGE